MSVDNAVTRRPHPVTAPRRCEATRAEIESYEDAIRADLRPSPRAPEDDQ